MEIRMSLIAEGVDSCRVSYWFVSLEDTVTQGDDLVEMETDKAVFTVPSPGSGKIVEILVSEGDEVKIGEVIAVIEG